MLNTTQMIIVFVVIFLLMNYSCPRIIKENFSDDCASLDGQFEKEECQEYDNEYDEKDDPLNACLEDDEHDNSQDKNWCRTCHEINKKWEQKKCDRKKKKYSDPCTVGDNQCADGLFCASDNDDYLHKNTLNNKCVTKGNKEDYCDPTFVQTKGRKGEKSCIDGLLCVGDNNNDYQCYNTNNRDEWDPCTVGDNQCGNKLFCSTDNKDYTHKTQNNQCMTKEKKGGSCDPTFEQTEGQKGEKSCIEGLSCLLNNEYGTYECS